MDIKDGSGFAFFFFCMEVESIIDSEAILQETLNCDIREPWHARLVCGKADGVL